MHRALISYLKLLVSESVAFIQKLGYGSEAQQPAW